MVSCDGRRVRARVGITLAFLTSLALLCGGHGAAGADLSLLIDGMSPAELYCLCLTPRAEFMSLFRIWNPSIGDLEVRASGYGDVVVYCLQLLDHRSCFAVSGNMTACYTLPTGGSDLGGSSVVLMPCQDQPTRLLLSMLVPVGDDLPLLIRNYSVEKSAGFYYDGRESIRIKLVPNLPGNVGRTVWVDKESGVLLSLEDVNYRGDVVQRLQTLTVDYCPELDKEELRCAKVALFTMAAREGGARIGMTAEYASQVLGFRITEPSWTPPGYELAGIRVLQDVAGRHWLARGVGGIAQLIYYDGLGMISLYERSVPWWIASTSEPKAGNVIEWEQNGIRYLLVGDIDPELLLRMARSIV